MHDDLLSLREIAKKMEQENSNNILLDEQKRKQKMINDIRQAVLQNFEIGDILFTKDEKMKEKIRRFIKDYLIKGAYLLSELEIDDFCDKMLEDLTGLGPIEKLRIDDNVKEIQINRYDKIYIYTTTGEKILTDIKFESEEHLIYVIEKIAAYNNKSFNYSSPRLKASLPNRARVHAVHNSVTANGTIMSIRKFPKRWYLPDLIENGAFTKEIGYFLTLIPRTRMTFATCGPTGSGKTTLGQALFDYAPENLSIISIEDTLELDLKHPDWRALVTREANSEGKGAVSIADLIQDCLRLQPDVIIVGEVRAPKDAYEMLQAFYTGHKGSFITIHASNTKNFVTRLASLLNASGQDVSITAAKQMIAEAFDYVIFQEKDEINEKTKKKKQMIKEIAEIRGFDEKTGEVIIENIFEYRVYGVDEEGNKIYRLEPTGVMPEKLFKACKDNNIPFDEKIFRKMFNL